MIKEYKFIIDYDGIYLHIKLKEAKFFHSSILISKTLPFLDYRIKRIKNKIIKREELYNKHFVK